MNSYL